MSSTKKLNDAGMVSIIITMILMLVISLIVLGFGEVTRRNQREVLDRQLSTQAFYAAETGVNDVLYKIVNAATDPDPYNYASPTTPNYNSCQTGSSTNFISRYLSSKATLHASGTVSDTAYTCLTVVKDLPSVVETVTLDSSQVVPLNLSSVTPLTFSWETNDSSRDATNCSTNISTTHPNVNALFEPNNAAGWQTNCPYGIMRVDLFDRSAGVSNPDLMAARTATLYLVPRVIGTAPSTIGYGKANIISATCTTATCTATVNVGANLQYYARVSAVYKDLHTVTISGQPPATFSGAQLLIDSTGRSQDQLRRIQVRVPLTTPAGGTIPVNALQSGGSICKRFITLGAGHKAADGSDADIPSELCSVN